MNFKVQLLITMFVFGITNSTTSIAEDTTDACLDTQTRNGANPPIIFNAGKELFVGNQTLLDASKKVEIRICNINTFKYKYTITTTAVDYHNLSIPSALAGLISSKAPSATPVQVVTSADYQVFKMFESESQKTKAANQCDSDSLKTNYEVIQNMNVVIEHLNGDKLNQLFNAVRNGKTNKDIKKEVASHCSNNQCDRDTLIGKVNEAFHALDDVYIKWKGNYAAWSKANKESVACNIDLGKYEFINSKLAEDYKKVDSKLTSTINNQIIVANIYNTISDDDIFPTEISKIVEAPDTDQLNATVQVELAIPTYLSINPSSDKDPTNNMTSAQPTIASNSYRKSQPIKNRWVLDYSAGLGTTNLKQVNYYLDSSKVINIGTTDSSNVGPAVLAQFYPTRLIPLLGQTYLSFGPCLGLLSTSKPTYLLGVSAIFEITPKIRISLSAGRAEAKITELNGDKVGSTPNGSSINTADHFKKGNFNSLTFALSF